MSTGSDSELPIRHQTSRSSRAVKTGYQRFERPVYDYETKYAPCRAGCPAGHDISWAIHLANRGRFDLALHTFREDNPFPAITGRVCYHPCERGCNRGDYDQPVAINALERALAEYGNGEPIESLPRQYEERIGIVGAGPAGLTCAYHLVRLGYPVTIYDANDRPGGVLAYGIPPYRLPREIVAGEIEALRTLGVGFRTGVRVGTDLSFAQLQEAHHALFLAPGLTRAQPLSLTLPKDPRIQSGFGFLRAAGTGTARALSGHVAVIGGGDVAIDAARSALRLGAQNVTICCLESRAAMPAHPEEIEAALQEGITILDGMAPQSIEANSGGLRLTLDQVESLRRHADGRLAIEIASGSPHTLRVAHLFYAVGQDADLTFLPEKLVLRGRIPVDHWGQTNIPGVYAGGDITGTYNVVNAVAGGKRAAIGIDARLRGRALDRFEEQIRVGPDGALSMRAYEALCRGENPPPAHKRVCIDDINLDYFPVTERVPGHEVDPAPRAESFAEVNTPFTPAEAAAEARRCFNCGTCNMCGNCFIYCPDSSVIQQEAWGFTIDLDHCKGCGVCVEECPRDSLSLVPEWEVTREHSKE